MKPNLSMHLLSIWLFISLSIWLYFVSKSLLIYPTLFDLSLSLITDNLLALLSYNLLLSLLSTFSYLFCRFFIGKLDDVDLARLPSLFHTLFPVFVFSIKMLRQESSLSYFILLPIPIIFRCVIFIFSQKVASFLLSPSAPPLSYHKRFITGQVLLFFIGLNLTIRFLHLWQETQHHPFFLMIFAHFVHGLIGIANDIFNHFVFAADHQNSGNSQAAFRAKAIGGIFFLALHVFNMIGYALFQIMATQYSAVFIVELISVIILIWKKFSEFYKWFRIRKVIGERLGRVEIEELEERLCIVCRAEMTVENARKLPCGHCFHIDCLERWMLQKTTCPTCERDLSELLNEHGDVMVVEEIVTEMERRERQKERVRSLMAALDEVRLELEELQSEVEHRNAMGEEPQF
jgi:E3 ubiquitin-protein ligase synoviolin